MSIFFNIIGYNLEIIHRNFFHERKSSNIVFVSSGNWDFKVVLYNFHFLAPAYKLKDNLRFHSRNGIANLVVQCLLDYICLRCVEASIQRTKLTTTDVWKQI